MLVLGRLVGETIHIGDDIVITIVRISDNAVRVGIDAPPDVNIARGELVDYAAMRLPAGTEIEVEDRAAESA